MPPAGLSISTTSPVKSSGARPSSLRVRASESSLYKKGSAECLKPQDGVPGEPSALVAKDSEYQPVGSPSSLAAPQQSQETTRERKRPASPQAASTESFEPKDRIPATAALKIIPNGVEPRHLAGLQHLPGILRKASLLDLHLAYWQLNHHMKYHTNDNNTKFFVDVARFISSRNLIRKAKRAVKVAQVKRRVELNIFEEGKEDGDKGKPFNVHHKLREGLENIQSLCEHNAHQFLRDGDCNNEIGKLQKQLKEILNMATKEGHRLRKEEPELAKGDGKPKERVYRPVLRRGIL
ncbi:hypothetical protein B0T10DRAFT_552346 [Thelonectria olida]|uniref:Uncharacterized protein n=1 Tax=Thelonectria olida TaxID=1576542 RepID=A0A9P9AKC8_9HYPO|nr:hypothetical protein B0T10DRAFT_552346 [Thelonectria olida]